jgi:2-dehydropantoate 2-reductase
VSPSETTFASSLGEALQHGPFDVALFALKSFDTRAAIEGMKPHRDKIPPVLCLSNGVESEPRLEAALGKDRLIPGTVTSAVGRKGIGDVTLEKLRGVGVAAGNPLSERLAAALLEAGLGARLYPVAADMKWSKLLTNLIANATAAILDMTPGEVFAHRGLFALEARMLREALDVMKAQGIRVVDVPGIPVRALAFAVRLPALVSRPLLARAVGAGRGAKMPSLHIDLHGGRGKSEVDFLNGAVVRHGEAHGLRAPVNRLLNETLLALTEGRLPPGDFSRRPEKLLSLARAPR